MSERLWGGLGGLGGPRPRCRFTVLAEAQSAREYLSMLLCGRTVIPRGADAQPRHQLLGDSSDHQLGHPRTLASSAARPKLEPWRADLSLANARGGLASRDHALASLSGTLASRPDTLASRVVALASPETALAGRRREFERRSPSFVWARQGSGPARQGSSSVRQSLVSARQGLVSARQVCGEARQGVRPARRGVFGVAGVGMAIPGR